MRTLRIVSSAMVLGFILVDHSQFAYAGPATHFTLRLNNSTIPWGYPPPEGLSSFCSAVPSGVHINPDNLGSNRVKKATQNNRSGVTKWIITDLVKGTATDNFGQAYRFVYENNATFDF